MAKLYNEGCIDAGYCRKPVLSELPEETMIRLKDTLRAYGYID